MVVPSVFANRPRSRTVTVGLVRDLKGLDNLSIISLLQGSVHE